MIIDPKSHVPIYRQIVEEILSAIASGVYRPGESLPSQRALAKEIRVNPNTIQRAYEELERQGVVAPRRGLGVFVIDRGRLSARGSAEKRTGAALKSTIRTALANELTPERIRELFETSLASSLQKVRKRN